MAAVVDHCFSVGRLTSSHSVCGRLRTLCHSLGQGFKSGDAQGATATGISTTAVGEVATASHTFAAAIGGSTNADGNGATALGGAWTNAFSRELKQDIEPLTSEMAHRPRSALSNRSVTVTRRTRMNLILDSSQRTFPIPWPRGTTRDHKGLSSMDIVAALAKVVQDQDRCHALDRERIAAQEDLIARQQRMLESLSKRLADLETQISSK